MSRVKGVHMHEQLMTYLLEISAARGKPLGELKPDDSLFDSGVLDSLSLLDFVMFLEKRYGFKIPGEEIVPENFGTLAAVGAYLDRRCGENEQP